MMLDSQMQSIPIDELLNKSQVLVDYYLRLGPNKFILVAKSGTNTPVDTLNKYKAKNVETVYVRLEDYQKLIQILIRSAGLAVGSKNVGDVTRLTMIEGAMSAVYQEMESLGFNEAVFSHAKLVNHSTLMFIESTPPFNELIAKLSGLRKDGVKHSMMVSLVSTMVGTGHDWVKQATLEKLALGGYLHDIGKIKLPTEIVNKPLNRMSRDERIIYQSHAEIGRQMVANVKTVPDDVALIVYEHHELADGSGFPRGLKDFQISPLARVVALANVFSELVMDLQEAGMKGPQVATEALERIEYHQTNLFNKDAIRALGRLVKGEAMQVAG